MNVLSLFDGMSCAQIALERAGIEVNNYYAAEIDKFAIKVTKANYPNTIHLGDVTKWQEWDLDWSSINFISAGFPCQSWSLAGKQLGDKDERGMLFWVMLDIMAHVKSHNPEVKFLIENVKMKKEFEEYITHHTQQALGHVHKTLINSALVSAQNRNRYYWTSFPVSQPEDKGIMLADIIDEYCDGAVPACVGSSSDRVIRQTKKLGCLTASYYKGVRASGRPMIASAGSIGRHIDECTDTDSAKCAAIRGRYTSDGSTKQTLEVRKDNKTNSLTTVQKDNVIVAGYSRKTGVGKEITKAYPLNASDWRVLNRNQTQNCVVFRPASIVGRRLNDRGVRDDFNKEVKITQCLQVKHNNDKSGCLTTFDKDNVLSPMPPGRYPDAFSDKSLRYRKLTPSECEKLQNVDVGYTSMVSDTQRYKMLGNGFTVDVIAHILRCSLASG